MKDLAEQKLNQAKSKIASLLKDMDLFDVFAAILDDHGAACFPVWRCNVGGSHYPGSNWDGVLVMKGETMNKSMETLLTSTWRLIALQGFLMGFATFLALTGLIGPAGFAVLGLAAWICNLRGAHWFVWI